MFLTPDNALEGKSPIREDFDRLARQWEQRDGVVLHLLQRVSKRLEFAMGSSVTDAALLADRHAIALDSQWIAQVYGWESLNEVSQRRLADELRRLGLRHHEWTVNELIQALQSEDAADLFRNADELREDLCGNQVHRRGLIEFSNHCVKNCAYCGLRRDNRKVTRYRMTEDEVLDCARQAKRLGYQTVVLQSGEDAGIPVGDICRWIQKIKQETGLAVTLSIGERSFEDYRALREAGADRYLMRFETSDPDLFARIKPGGTLEGRLEKLKWLKELGYEVGSGCLIGLPGQSVRSLAEDLLLFRKLDLDMVGVGPFIPHPETPLKDERQGSLEMTLKFVALVRLVTKNAHVPATTALGSIHPYGRQLALERGANIIMPNVTPARYRSYYEIYPNKICLTENARDCGGCTAAMIHSLGRTVGEGAGGSFKKSSRSSPTHP